MAKISLSSNQLAQGAHVGIGAAAVALPIARYAVHHFAIPKLDILLGGIILISFAATKEFWFDPTFETPATQGSDLEDFLYYLAGLAAAYLFILL